jgi:hypothetical protein
MVHPTFYGRLLLAAAMFAGLLFPVSSKAGIPSVAEASLPIEQVRETGFFSGAWPVEREWDQEAELEFALWVETIGRAREKKVFRIARGLKDSLINPLYTPEDRRLRFETDCATLPYAMRAYFAWKTKRPFSWNSNKGRRYASNNHPERWSDFSQFKDPVRLIVRAMADVSSATFRMHARLEGTDTYPIDPTRFSILPGTTYYDPNGHVLLVYRVDSEKGNVHMMDSHPDGTLTLKVFGPKIKVGTARFGGGFRAWRHYRVELLDWDTGSFRIVRDTNAECPWYSDTAQYRGKYPVGDSLLSFHEWIRWRVRQPRSDMATN